MERIAEAGNGMVIYLRQEGRGIGLAEKLKAYNLQVEGYDTVEANLILGHQADERDYTVVACILHDFGVRSISLLTNNPEKITALRKLGIRVNERLAVEATVYTDNANYLEAKVKRMHHLLNLNLMDFNPLVASPVNDPN
jgi:GTP cyclohydrolase II